MFTSSGFCIVEGVLKLHQCMSVLSDCERAAREMIDNGSHK